MIDVADKQRQELDPSLKDILERDKAPDRDLLYCATCSHVVGSNADRTEVNGSFDHILTNPHGFRFHLGCYAQALGCTIAGNRTAADTWFMGYEWRFANCAECNTHLGWYFDRADHFFYGIVLDRVQSE